MPRPRPRRVIGGGGNTAAPPPPRAAGYIIRASELGVWSYCERAWWLRYVAAVTPPDASQARLQAGHLRHAEHGRRYRRAAFLWRAGLACLALAALATTILLLSLFLPR